MTIAGFGLEECPRPQQSERRDSARRRGQRISRFAIPSFRGILGNALWTHSQFQAPRQQDGVFAGNVFDTIGRDALLVGHATRVRVREQLRASASAIRWKSSISKTAAFPSPWTPPAMWITRITCATRLRRSTASASTWTDFTTARCATIAARNRKAAEDYPFGSLGMAMNNTHPDAHSNNIEITRQPDRRIQVRRAVSDGQRKSDYREIVSCA